MVFELKLLSQKSEMITLAYEVQKHSFARRWYESFKTQSLKNLRPGRDIFNNFEISQAQLEKKICRLQALIDSLNTFVSPKITNQFDPSNAGESVNKLHVHFPELERTETDTEKRLALSEYNDLIHFLEAYFSQEKFRQSHGVNLSNIALCFESSPRFKIQDDEWDQFSSSLFFGDVVSHYPHVGRRPSEIYWSKDKNIPNH